MARKSYIDRELVRSLLDYDNESGVFTWKTRTARRVHVGDIAGSVTKQGYLGIKILGERYLAHRLAWLYEYGAFPEGFIDHANMNRLDNRLINLRLATHQENKRNGKRYRNNTSGYRGVYLKNGRYEAYLMVDKKVVYVGRYITAEGASFALEEVAQKVHGDFYRRNND